MSAINNETSSAGRQNESDEEQKISLILKGKNWGRLWDTVRSYLKRRNDILINISSRIEDLADPQKFEKIESSIECLSKEAAAGMYIVLIYKAAVLNSDPKSGNYFLEKLNSIPVFNYSMSEYEWYMAVKNEASGVKGALDKVKEMTGDRTGDGTNIDEFLEILPALFRIAEKNRELILKIVNHVFYTIWDYGNSDGFLGAEEPLQDFADILAGSKITDINIWDKILKAAKVINGVEEKFDHWDEVPKPIVMNEGPAVNYDLLSTLTAIRIRLGGHPVLHSIGYTIKRNLTKDEEKRYTNNFLNIISGSTIRNYPSFFVTSSIVFGINSLFILNIGNLEVWKNLLKLIQARISLHKKINDNDKFRTLSICYSLCALLSRKLKRNDDAEGFWKKADHNLKKIENVYQKTEPISIMAWSLYHSGNKKRAHKIIEKIFTSYDERIDPYDYRYLNSLFEGAESVEQRLKSEKNIDNTPERTIDECLTIKDTQCLKKRIGSFTFKLNEEGESEEAFNVWVKNIHRTEKTMTQLKNPYALLHASISLFNDKKTGEALEILEKTFERIGLDNDENYKCGFIEEAALNLEVRNSEILDMILKHTHEISCHSKKATLLSKLAGYMQNITMFETAKKVWLDALAIIEDGLLHSDMSETMKSILQHIRSHEVKEIEILKKALEISGKIVKKWGNPGPFIDTLQILLSANPERADLWDEAISISEIMTENENLVTVYSHIATGLAITGCQAGAKKYLKRAVLLAEGSSNDYLKDKCLKEIAIRCGEIGFLEEGLSIGKKIKTEYMKVDVYSFIALKMSQNGEEKESDIVLKQAFEIVSASNSKSSSLASIVFWMGQNRDREKTSQILGSVFNIIEGIPEVSDKLWSLREIITRMVGAKDNAYELIFDMIKENISELIDKLEEKPGDDISEYLISSFGFCLGNAGVLDPGPWQKVNLYLRKLIEILTDQEFYLRLHAFFITQASVMRIRF